MGNILFFFLIIIMIYWWVCFICCVINFHMGICDFLSVLCCIYVIFRPNFFKSNCRYMWNLNSEKVWGGGGGGTRGTAIKSFIEGNQV